MSKDFKFDQAARDKILSGVNILAKAVGTTLGPKGRTVLIQKPYGSAVGTKDGVSVAREVSLEDPFENMGCDLVKQAAEKTCSDTGDGTTSATVLAQKLIEEGLKLVSAGHAPIDLKRGIDFAVSKVVDELRTKAKEVTSSEEIAQVGTISANGDAEVGNMIADAMKQVGNEGVITLEEGKSMKDELTVVNGYQFDKGYLSPHFATNDRLECVLENPAILITDKNINNVSVVIPIMEKTAKAFPGRSLLIIADNVEGDALPTMILNHLKKSLISCAVRAPGFGDRRKEMLQDLATLTGATCVSEDLGTKLEQFDASMLGSAKRVIINGNNTTVVEGGGDLLAIEDRVAKVRASIEMADGDWDVKRQEERLAKMVGGVAVIAVGAATEGEMKEKKDRVEDALAATKAAVEEGIVSGGGVALLRAAKVLDKLDAPAEFKYGIEIVKKAALEPFRRILLNAGKDPSEVLMTVMSNPDERFGYNAQTENFEDLMASGVIDPVKVVRCALQNAASVAGLVLTTECMIVNKPEKKEGHQQHMGME